MRSWKRSILTAVIAAAAVVGSSGCVGERGHRRIDGIRQAQIGQGMSKEAADLAHRETIEWLYAQEVSRREPETRLPRHVQAAPTSPVPEPEGQPVAERANGATGRERTPQMERLAIGTAPGELQLPTAQWSSPEDLACAVP